jgi:hypothetical protein
MLEGEKYNSTRKLEFNFFKKFEKLTFFFCYFNILKYSIEIENKKEDYRRRARLQHGKTEQQRSTQESIEKEWRNRC